MRGSFPVEGTGGRVVRVESGDLSGVASVRERSEDLSVNVGITSNVELDLEVSSSNNRGGEVDGSESLVGGASSGLNESFAFDEELSLFGVRDFVFGSTTAHCHLD